MIQFVVIFEYETIDGGLCRGISKPTSHKRALKISEYMNTRGVDTRVLEIDAIDEQGNVRARWPLQ